MGRKGHSRAKHYRCRAGLGIRFSEEERGMTLGPGSIIDEETYAELIEKGFVLPTWFEPIAVDEAEPQNESEM